MTANEAASVTGVPLRQVHRIIDAGLLGGAVKRRDNARLLAPKALVGLKLAHETADVLTLQSRRAVVATSIRRPRQAMIRTNVVVIDARPAARAVRSGLSQLSKARGIVTSAPDVLSGTPTVKGTRIPVHRIADMLANGDRPAAIMKAFPQLDEEKNSACGDLCAGLSAAGPAADEIIAAVGAPQEFGDPGFRQARARVKFLVDECLSSELVTIARSRGNWESTHVTWLGLRSRKDWSIVRRAINDGYVLVTNDKTDFISLIRREKVHAGLVCLNVAHGLMSLERPEEDVHSRP